MTENYYIIVEQPLSLSVPAIVSNKLIKNGPLAGCFRWYHEEKVKSFRFCSNNKTPLVLLQTQINLICRRTGERKYIFLTEPFFYLHIINQYEKNDCLFLDICAYRDPAMLDCMYIENLKSMQRIPEYAKMFRGRPIRFALPLLKENDDRWLQSEIKIEHCRAKARVLEGGEIFVEPERLCNLGCETPRINYERFFGKPYRYFYAISSDVDANNPGTVSGFSMRQISCALGVLHIIMFAPKIFLL